MTQAHKAKPSEAHGNDEILRAKAQEANRKRAERKRQAAREEARAQAEADRKAREEAEAKAKAEAEAKAKEEPKAKTKEEPKKDRKFGKVIKVRANGKEYATLTEFVLTLPNCGKVDGKHSAYAISVWNKLNGQLKKKGWADAFGTVVEAI